MKPTPFAVAQRSESVLATNRVLRNTYLLLGATLLFSAAAAGYAMLINAAPLNPWITILGYFGLLFLTNMLKNQPFGGIAAVFALTGFMGYTLGPILNFYIHTFQNGNEIVMMSLGSTGLIFFALSAYAMTTRKDFSFMAGFLVVGAIVAFLGSLATLFFHIPALMLAVSAAFVIISSGLILLETSQIISGGEQSYIMATVTIYVSLYNLFISLLNLFGAFTGNRE